MGELLAKRLEALNGGQGKKGVILSLATPYVTKEVSPYLEVGVPSLASKAVKDRLRAAQDGGATAFSGHKKTVGIGQQEFPTLGRILVTTTAQEEGGSLRVTRNLGLHEAKEADASAVGSDYFAKSKKAGEQEGIIESLAEDIRQQGAEIPVVTFVYPVREGESASWKAQAALRAVDRGADAVVVGHSIDQRDFEVVDAIHKNSPVPVYLMLHGDFGGKVDYPHPLSVLQQAEVAKDTDAAGIVIDRLRLGSEDPSLTQMIAAVREVVQDGKSPYTAYRDTTKVLL